RVPTLRTHFPYTTLFRSLPLLAPLHLSQVGLGPRSDCRTSTTLPCRVPSWAWVISTMDFTLPVSSSMVFQRPTGPSEAQALAERSEEHTSELQSRENLVC